MIRVLVALFAIPVLASARKFPAFDWAGKVGSGQDVFTGLGADAAGNVYVVGSTSQTNLPVKSALQATLASPGANDVFITKLDPSGNTVYSTYFGGAGEDTASAMTVDASGNVFVTGMTYSPDFPTTKNAFLPKPPARGPWGQRGSSFLFRVNPDGTLGYSTYFTPSETNPAVIAVDITGSAYVGGSSNGGLPVTPGAYQSVCDCGFTSTGFFSVPYFDGFLARFDPSGSKLIFATYLGVRGSIGISTGAALAVAMDGSAYVGGTSGIYRLDATGSSLLGHGLAKVNVQALALQADGSVYAAGTASGSQGAAGAFQPTPGAAQPNANLLPNLPYQPILGTQQAVVRMDAQMQKTLAATYFGGPYGNSPLAMTLDAAGNLYLGGWTSPHGLPTVTPFVEAFGSPATGFASKLSGDLSTVLFSSYFGDAEYFQVQGIAVGQGGKLVLGGVATPPPFRYPLTQGAVWVNSVRLTSPPDLRIDSVVNAASLLDDPISPSETIVVRGTGFGPDAQVLLGGVPGSILSVTPTRITALAPANLTDPSITVQVQSGGTLSNSVLAPVASASPGLFSADGTGTGQGYITNADGTLNAPANPAKPGDRITIYATGVGPLTFDHGYAVTANPVNVYVEGFYAPGVAAVAEPVPGFPGDVYQLTVYVPDPATLIAANPDLKNFKFAPLVGIVLRIANGASQYGLALSIAQ